MNHSQYDAAVELQLDLFRASAGIEKDVLRILLGLRRDLLGRVAEGKLTEWGKARVKNQLREVSALIDDYYKKVADVSSAGLGAIAEVSARGTVAAVAEATIPAKVVLESIASNSIVQGAVVKDWWSRQSEDTAFRFSQAIRQGVAGGETNQQIINRVKDFLNVSQSNAAALVQTATATVANDSRQAVFDANQDIIKRYRALATLDTHTCLTCAPLDGLEWTKAGNPINHKFPFPRYPLHFNCLTGDAHVSATDDVTGVTKRWFDGEVVIIGTASGKKLTCTPNHPILTGGGWVAAGLLDVGGNVVCNLGSQGEAGIDSHHEHVPSTIHEFSESFLSARNVSPVPVPVASGDFHGDGIGSDVAVVYTDSFLGDGLDASGVEHSNQLDLISRSSDISSSLFSECRLLEAFDAALASASRLVCALSEHSSFRIREGAHSGGLLLAPVSGWNPGISEYSVDSQSGDVEVLRYTGDPDARVMQSHGLVEIDLDKPPAGINTSSIEPSDNGIEAYAELASELLAGSSGPVLADEIINIKRELFHGYVYNLETEKGWYIANGIVTHNCRCLMLPVVLDVPRGTRASSDGQVPADLNFSGWLKRQSKAKQDEVLGPGRAALFRNGKLTLADLVNGRGNPFSVESLRKKYA